LFDKKHPRKSIRFFNHEAVLENNGQAGGAAKW